MTNIKLIEPGGMPAVDRSAELCVRIKDLIYEYSGMMPLATAVGVLEIVKVEILAERT